MQPICTIYMPATATMRDVSELLTSPQFMGNLLRWTCRNRYVVTVGEYVEVVV